MGSLKSSAMIDPLGSGEDAVDGIRGGGDPLRPTHAAEKRTTAANVSLGPHRIVRSYVGASRAQLNIRTGPRRSGPGVRLLAPIEAGEVEMYSPLNEANRGELEARGEITRRRPAPAGPLWEPSTRGFARLEQ